MPHSCNVVLPDYAVQMATLPEELNGLGLYTPCWSALTSFAIPVARAIHYMTVGTRIDECIHQCSDTI